MTEQVNRREELRGIFILGLLAVLIVIRYQTQKLMVQIGQFSFDFIPFINLTIILWSLYAFFMVFGLSGDVVGENLAEGFRNVSIYCLRLDFIWSAFIGVLYFVLGYYPRSVLVIEFVVAAILIGILLLLRKTKPNGIWKRPKITRLDLAEWATSSAFVALLAGLLFYPDERYLVVFLVSSLVFYTAFVLVHEKKSEEKDKSAQQQETSRGSKRLRKK